MWGKARGEARLLSIGRKGGLQGRLQGGEGVMWLWGEPDSRLSQSARERPKGCESHLKCSALPANLQQPGQDLTKVCAWHKGVQQGDMGHPTVDMTVMLTPDRLYG